MPLPNYPVYQHQGPSLDTVFQNALGLLVQGQQQKKQQEMQNQQLQQAQQNMALQAQQAAAERSMNVLKFGFDPSAVTPSMVQQAQGPAPDASMMSVDTGSPIAAMRAFIAEHKIEKTQKQEASKLSLDEKRANIKESEAKAGLYGRGGAAAMDEGPETIVKDGVTYRKTLKGEWMPVPVAPELKLPSQAESVARGFSDKATMANQDLERVIAGGFDPGAKSGVVAERLPNIFKSESRQQYDQAKRQFVNAVLRRESGAAITPSEMDSYTKQYFPVAGDAQGTIEQKARARQAAIAGIAQEGRRVPSVLGGGEVQTRTLKSGAVVKVRRDASGKWVEVQ